MRAKLVREELNEKLNTLQLISIGYLSGFVLSKIIKFLSNTVKKNEEWNEANETMEDLINLIQKDQSFTVMEYGDRYFITSSDKELEQQLGSIRVFKERPVINVAGFDLILLDTEQKKLLDFLKSKI
jgi:hypothetical protein